LRKTCNYMVMNPGSLECTRLLLSRGADAAMWDCRRQNTPLHMAASCTGSICGEASVPLMQLLVNNKGDINAGLEQDGGASVLHAAVRANNIAAVRFLLDNKVQTLTKKFSGESDSQPIL
jgi:ankyrin repeat protein